MSRKDDVVKHFMGLYAVRAIESEKILTLLEQAVNFGFEQGESYGKYGAYIEKQNEKIAEAIIQPENDRVWERELAELRAKCRESNLEGRILLMIAEMILYRRRGG